MDSRTSYATSGPGRTFEFLDPGELVDAELELTLAEKRPAVPSLGYLPSYLFDMRAHGEPRPVGQIALRVGDSQLVRLFRGHIGYEVKEEHRGHAYAARACRLLLPLARKHGLHELWITCNADNAASRRTCERAGGTFVGVADVPAKAGLYGEAGQRKCRYRIALD